MKMKIICSMVPLGAVLAVHFFATIAVDGAAAPEAQIDSFSEKCLANHDICPCNCTSLGQGRIKHLLVECTGMSTFLKYLPPGTTDLSLTDNSVESFTANDLNNVAEGLKEVRNFKFSNGILKEIPVLHGFPRLRSLDLSYNLLGNIPPEIFVNLKNLKTLNLVGNPGLNCARMKKELENVAIYCDDNPVSAVTLIYKEPTFGSEEGFQETMESDLALAKEEPSSGVQSPEIRERAESTTEELNSTSTVGGIQSTTQSYLDQASTGRSSAFKTLVPTWMERATFGTFLIIWTYYFFG